MHNEDLITLTFQGVQSAANLSSKKFGDIRDDIVMYLMTAPNQSASCEELGMAIKVLGEEIKPAIKQLKAEGYVDMKCYGHEVKLGRSGHKSKCKMYDHGPKAKYQKLQHDLDPYYRY